MAGVGHPEGLWGESLEQSPVCGAVWATGNVISALLSIWFTSISEIQTHNLVVFFFLESLKTHKKTGEVGSALKSLQIRLWWRPG